MSVEDRCNFLWLNKISNILNECGMSNIWNTQTFLNSTWLINTVKLKLRDQYEQTWISLIDDSPKANNYKLIKTSFQMEDYFELLEHKKAIDFCRFRTTNHKFPIEQGRWDNIDRNFILICKFIIFCIH